MIDDPRLAVLGQFTPEGTLTPGYGDSYKFFAGRDDIHGVLKYLMSQEQRALLLGMYGYDDEELNQIILDKLQDDKVRVQITLDKSQAGGVHEKQLLDHDRAVNPHFFDTVAIGQSATHQISHLKMVVLVGLGCVIGGSTNWSQSGEGVGVVGSKGYKSQNNSLDVSFNHVAVSIAGEELNREHQTALQQMTQASHKTT